MAEIRTYILILYLPTDATLTVGDLGTYDLFGGFYAYVDEVEGTTALTRRLKRHLSPPEKPQSDIDHLQQLCRVEEIWLSSSSESRRQAWTDLLIDIPDSISLIDGFGGAES